MGYTEKPRPNPGLIPVGKRMRRNWPTVPPGVDGTGRTAVEDENVAAASVFDISPSLRRAKRVFFRAFVLVLRRFDAEAVVEEDEDEAKKEEEEEEDDDDDEE
jgi:hypothetical protein